MWLVVSWLQNVEVQNDALNNDNAVLLLLMWLNMILVVLLSTTISFNRRSSCL